MTDFLARHLLDSTLFCLLLGGFAGLLSPQRAAARHTLWLAGVCKFALPTALLTATGERMAFVLPAGETLSVLVARVSAFLSSAFNWLPTSGHIAFGNMASFLISTVWCLGALVMLARWLRSSRAREELNGCGAYERDLLDKTCEQLGIRQSVPVYSSNAVTEPMLAGILSPRICLPADLSGNLSASEFQTVLLHELAHLKGQDNLTGAIVRLVLCVFWFHPLLWWAQARLLVERERACDQIVVTSGAAAKTYIAGIFKVCGFGWFESIGGTSRMSGSDIKNRLDLIVNTHRPPMANPLLRFFLAIALTLIALIPIAGGYCEQCVSNGQRQSNAETPCGSVSANQHPCQQ